MRTRLEKAGTHRNDGYSGQSKVQRRADEKFFGNTTVVLIDKSINGVKGGESVNGRGTSDSR